MKKLLIVIMILLVANVCWAADLNAPAQKQITVGSEINRGNNEMFSALLDTGINFTDVSRVAFGVLDKNKSNNTDTDAFLLGAYFEIWNKYAIKLDNENSRSYYGETTWLKAQNSCKLWFKEFRKMEEKLNIDDKTLCETINVNYEVMKPIIDKWETN